MSANTLLQKSNSQETRWFYRGPDNETYGPYSPKDMMLWTQSGYFNETLLVKTEHDTQYHTLGEWNRLCGGQPPFTLNVFSMEQLMQQINKVRPQVMMIPPPFAQSVGQFCRFTEGTPVHFPYMHPAGPLGPMIPNGAGPNGVHLHSKQPVESGKEVNNLPATPESDQEIRRSASHANQIMALLTANKDLLLQPAIELASATTQTEKHHLKDASTQTAPLIVPSKQIAVFLSELFGQTVHLT